MFTPKALGTVRPGAGAERRTVLVERKVQSA